MTSLLEYYRMKNDYDTNSIVFEKVKEEDIKIYGKTIQEIITILEGLSLEKMLDIKMTMDNLSILFEELRKRDTLNLAKAFDKSCNLVSENINYICGMKTGKSVLNQFYYNNQEFDNLKQALNELEAKLLSYGETFDSDIHKQFQKDCLDIIEGVKGDDER